MKTLCGVALSILLSACALPHTSVYSGSVRPTLAVSGAPPGAVLFIDGLSVGTASEFDGVAKVLNLEEGRHQVEIRNASRTLYQETIYISNGEERVVRVGSVQQ